MGSAARMGLLGGERRAMKSPAYRAAPDESGLGCCNGERRVVQTSGR